MDLDKTLFWLSFPFWAVTSLIKKHRREEK